MSASETLRDDTSTRIINALETLDFLLSIISLKAKEVTLYTMLINYLDGSGPLIVERLISNIATAIISSSSRVIWSKCLILLSQLLFYDSDKVENGVVKFYNTSNISRAIFNIILHPVLDEVENHNLMLSLKLFSALCSQGNSLDNAYTNLLGSIFVDKLGILANNLLYVCKTMTLVNVWSKRKDYNWIMGYFYGNNTKFLVNEAYESDTLIFLKSYYHFTKHGLGRYLESEPSLELVKCFIQLSFYMLFDRCPEALCELSLGVIHNMVQVKEFFDLGLKQKTVLFSENIKTISSHLKSKQIMESLCYIDWLIMLVNECLRRISKKSSSLTMQLLCVKSLDHIMHGLSLKSDFRTVHPTWQYLFKYCNYLDKQIDEKKNLDSILPLLMAISNILETFTFYSHSQFIETSTMNDFYYEMIRNEELLSHFFRSVDTLIIGPHSEMFVNTKKALSHFKDAIAHHYKDDEIPLDAFSVMDILKENYKNIEFHFVGFGLEISE